MITDRTGLLEVLLPINHENYNFREKKISLDMKERENFSVKEPQRISKLSNTTGGWQFRDKYNKASARMQAGNYNF